jgi:hypothetical protein
MARSIPKPGGLITRRQALVGAAAVGAAAALPLRPAFAAERLFFYQLYSTGTELSETALALNGKAIEMVGFMAPPLKAEADFFVLTDVPMEFCPFCDEIALWPDNIIYVTSDRPIPTIPFNREIRVEGILDLGAEVDPATGFVSLVRLEQARVVRA